MQPASTSSPVDVPPFNRRDQYLYNLVKVRCENAEQELRVTRGTLAILQSKKPQPIERELVLMKEVEDAAAGLLCKYKARSPRAFFACVTLDF